MKLIADSGSTKTDWRIISPSKEISQARSLGINPYYQSAVEIAKELKESLLPQLDEQPEEIYFYGAGCSAEATKQIVKEALQDCFGSISIHIHHDMLAAAHALCGHEAGIACILGTGSNACVFDGTQIIEQAPAPGYILGDEGGGAYLGKVLLSDYLHKLLPNDLHQAFDKRYGLSREDILQKVYKEPYPNRFLASFSRFLFHHQSHPYVYRLLYTAFQAFIERNIKQFDNYSQYKVHFTGSVAFYYSNILRQVCNDQGLVIKNILESPIAGLALFHTYEE
ncbi:N-acetylglucosamine kinase [Cytophagales bacterium LB-30]|uniref:N-acetylglucosamine kinase n=2 Tax=Shiella aurantiaca TaxID=3058365 RepID=A0ABT8F618_9BACT|nr:N-acetylglucosamine kinase [Shiella aurantiaca]